MIKRLYYKLFPHYRRLEIKCCTYPEGDKLIRGNDGQPEVKQWVIAREEDNNQIIGMVYLERRERIWE